MANGAAARRETRRARIELTSSSHRAHIELTSSSHRAHIELEERRIELAAAAAAKAAADGAADGVVVNDDRIARWAPKQKGYHVYTFNVKEGGTVMTIPDISSPTTTQAPTTAPRTGRELQLHARNYNTCDL
eukprot:jgi/Chrpa1/22468/Chrysochromulina_OHIO_Genome00025487-RA